MKPLHPAWGAQIEPGARPSGPRLFLASGTFRRDFRPERAEHTAPDLAVGPYFILVVVQRGPRFERGLRLRIERPGRRPAVKPERREAGLQFAYEGRAERQDILRILAIQQGEVVDGEDPVQLLDRPRMVVDPDVDPAVVEAPVPAAVPDHEEGRRLLPAAIASRRLPGAEGREEANRQVALGRFERMAHRLDDVLAREQIALGRKVLPDKMARPRKALLPRVRGGPPARIDDARLAFRRFLVGLREALEDLLRGGPLLQHLEGFRPVGRVRVRLGRDRPDPRERERDDGSDRDELRLDRDPEILRLRIEPHDAEGGRPGGSHRTGIDAELFRGSRNP